MVDGGSDDGWVIGGHVDDDDDSDCYAGHDSNDDFGSTDYCGMIIV